MQESLTASACIFRGYGHHNEARKPVTWLYSSYKAFYIKPNVFPTVSSPLHLTSGTYVLLLLGSLASLQAFPEDPSSLTSSLQHSFQTLPCSGWLWWAHFKLSIRSLPICDKTTKIRSSSYLCTHAHTYTTSQPRGKQKAPNWGDIETKGDSQMCVLDTLGCRKQEFPH